MNASAHRRTTATKKEYNVQYTTEMYSCGLLHVFREEHWFFGIFVTKRCHGPEKNPGRK